MILIEYGIQVVKSNALVRIHPFINTIGVWVSLLPFILVWIGQAVGTLLVEFKLEPQQNEHMPCAYHINDMDGPEKS